MKNSPALKHAYLLSFLIALHFGLPVYINSSYLANFIPEGYIGLVFTAAAVILLFILGLFRFALERIGNVMTIEWLMVAELGALCGLLYGAHAFVVIPAMVAHLIVGSLMAFSMDIFLEDASKRSAVGRIRGWFLTASNVGILCSPLLVGILLSDGDFWKVYIAATAVLIFIFLVVIKSYAAFKDPRYEHASFRTTWEHLQKQRDILRICIINFLLYFFYAIMVAYTPLYLSEHLHFSWATIGWMFTIMLTPFVFLQLPLGRLADTRFGEKEILTIGFLIAAGATSVLAFISGASALLWALALFATRVGASAIEIMTETYFFKKIKSTDTPALTFFRMMRPLGYIVGPLVATLTLLFFDFKYIFPVLGAVMLTGIYFSLSIKDTR